MKNLLLVSILSLSLLTAFAQSEQKKDKIIEDSKEAKDDFIEGDWQMKKHFAEAYGYVIYPNVGKGGIGIGGAAGNGVAYEQGNMVGMAKLSQLA